jgi:TPR repeat protein
MGQGVAKDETAAVEWFRKAAEQNDPTAQANLGFCYFSGQGVPKDAVEALKWWLLAGAQGNSNAKVNIGIMQKSLTTQQLGEAQTKARNWLERNNHTSAAGR